MPERIRILACQHQVPEFKAAAATIASAVVEVEAYPSRCGLPPMTWEELAPKVDPAIPTLLVGGCCLAHMNATPPGPCAGVHICQEAQCASFAAEPTALASHLQDGAYLLTPGWLKTWRTRLEEWHGDQEALKAFWRESATRLVYLDTGTLALDQEAYAFASAVDRPLEILRVGNAHLEHKVERLVLDLQAEHHRNRINENLRQARRQAAERATALEFLSELSQSLKESEVVSRIAQMFSMLFGASQVELILSQPGESTPLLSPSENDHITPDGFLVRIGTSQEDVGILSVRSVEFPQHLPEYLNLTISMAGVCALAILNARTYKAVEDSRASQRLMLDVLDVFYRPGVRGDEPAAAMKIIQAYLRADAFSLRLYREGGLETGLSQGLPAPCEMLRDANLPKDVTAHQRCLCNALLSGSRPRLSPFLTPRGSLWIQDLPSALPRLSELGLPGATHSYCLPEGFRSILIIPLVSNGLRVGLLHFCYQDSSQLDPSKVELLEGVASTMTVGLVRRWAEEDLRLANLDLESRVQHRTEELATINRDLRTEITQRVQAEHHLAQKTLELKKRIKELECLYAVSTLLERHEESLDSLLRRSTSLIPKGWGSPELTRARVVLDDTVYAAQPFVVTPRGISREIVIAGRSRGRVEVAMDPTDMESLFHEEESHLLEAITELLSTAIERAEIHAEKLRVEQQLIQSQKLEAIGTLAGGIAHDFNNILTPILCSAEIALLKVDEANPIRKQLQLIHDSGQRAKDLVNQILLFGRRHEGLLKPIPIAQTVTECLKLIRAMLPSTIEIRQHISAQGVQVLADDTQIHQILMNLCTNAYHAMEHQNGLLEVSLKLLDISTESAGMELTPGPHVALLVSDTGQGMPPEVVTRIFEPFFTTKEAGKGTGLGLSVVHGLIKSYGGQISVTSEPGRGTAFKVLLPVLQDRQVEPARHSAEQLPQGTERILIVDDEPTICEATSALLENLGYQIDTELDSSKALALLIRNPDAFDLVLTDYTLPQMTGIALATELHALRPALPILLCSGLTPPLDAKGQARLGIRDFIQKPFTAQRLAQAVRTALDQPTADASGSEP